MINSKEKKEISMKIYFVRHGKPNYEKDCLTDLGHMQADAAAKRLKNEGLQKIFSSTCGRAIETAEHTASELGLDVESYDFMREIHWNSKNGEELFATGNPWDISDDMILKGENVFDPDWANSERFSSSIIGEFVQGAAEGFDEWMKTLGYEREGNFYRVIGDNTDQTIAMFSHAGSSSAVLAHLFGLSFLWFVAAVRPDFTSIAVVEFSNKKGTLCLPTLRLLNDAKHIEGIEAENIFGN